MKIVTRLVFTLFVGGAFIASAHADDPSSQFISTSDKLSLNDPDGNPLIVTHPETKAPTDADLAAQKRNAQQSAADSDWLLRSYEQQMQRRNASVPGSQSDNLYYRIASDKTLAKLAGVNPIDTPLDPGAALKTGSGSGQSTLALRPDAQSNGGPTAGFKPLITPIGAADAAGLHNFYNTLPAVVPPSKNKRIDPADMEMPGKLAADSKSPLSKESLTFDQRDALPDEDSAHSSHLDGASKALPLSTNMAQVQKVTDAALLGPGMTKSTTSANVSALQLQMTAEPPPPKLVSPATGRMPIASPYSILDR